MNIALIYGGRSGEHEVSINSAKGVYPALCNLGHTVYLVAITLEGRWFLQDQTVREHEHKDDKPIQLAVGIEKNIGIASESGEENTQKIPIGTPIRTNHPLTIHPGEGVFCGGERLALDAAFAVTHGFGGEDGNLQGLCLLANLPLCGCDTLSSAIGMHKDIAAKLFALEGIPTVPSQLLSSQDILWLEGKTETPPSWLAEQNQENDMHASPNSEKERWPRACLKLQRMLGPSLFIKPEDSGSSLGVTALRTPDGRTFEEAVREARRHSGCILVQALIEPMDELECAVLEMEDGTLIAAGPARVVDPGKQSNHFLSYAYKYSQVDCAYLQLPSLYPENTDELIRKYAKQAFRAIGGEGYARVDFFVSGDAMYLNEINTSPGMTDKSHFPLLMAHAGYSMEQVVQTLIEDALQRKRQENQRSYRPPGA